MRKIFFVLMLIGISFSALAQIKSLSNGKVHRQIVGSSNAHLAVKPNVFNSLAEAKLAYNSGNFSYYKPSDFRSYGVNPVDGTSRVLVSLEQDAFALMPVVGGIKYVIIERNSSVRFYVNESGNIASAPYALDACGNAISEFEYAVRCNPCSESSYNNNLNYYSKKTRQSYKTPSEFTYTGENNDVESYVAKKGWPTWAKVLVVGAAVTVTGYLIYNAREKSGSGEQKVVTLPPSVGPESKSPPSFNSFSPMVSTVGLSYSVSIH